MTLCYKSGASRRHLMDRNSGKKSCATFRLKRHYQVNLHLLFYSKKNPPVSLIDTKNSVNFLFNVMSYLTSKGILPSVGLSTGLVPCSQPPHQRCIISVGHHINSDSLLWATTSNPIPCCGPRHQSWLADVL